MSGKARRAVCPHCGYGGVHGEKGVHGPPFFQIDMMYAYAKFFPRVKEDGTVDKDWTGWTEPVWDTQKPHRMYQPTGDVWSPEGAFGCPACREQFDEFKIVEVEDDE